MTQIFDPLPSRADERALCCYVNATSQIQIARITNVPNWYFERVVFPGQRLVFEASSLGMLEIHTGNMASAIISDTIPCSRLQVDQEKASEGEPPQAPIIAAGHGLPVAQSPRTGSGTFGTLALSSAE
ncbi:MAG: DUF1830 domain-containing protein [Oscillatoriales cyanobacterium RM1_1_9]|nr:DUF1830 domain-containing protein [Oscillatoriales cyanobacterium SM2_3_0]NJO47076.1 DUF1830 domain-containing protein [Oscillatoriales cyanobacterium RM2_1_1]NJO70681.1 DUF1830 domain-containing protein [Oscillatoriales cyanobacterium RM1_1_9]